MEALTLTTKDYYRPDREKWEPVNLTGKLFRWYLLRPSHPFKVRFENWIGHLFFRKGILLEGYDVRLQLDANDWITRTMIEKGHFESLSLKRARSIMKNGGNFVDIGANFGIYTCVLGIIPAVHCLSVDASPKIMAKLRKNLAINPEIRTQVVQVALSSDYGQVKFFCPNKGNAGTSRTVMVDKKVSKDYIVLDSIPLNALLADIDLKSIDLLKIDIEGFEMEVFKNFDFYGKYRPANIIMEFDPKLYSDGFNFSRCRSFFEKKGYELFNVKGEKLESGAEIIENNLWLKSKRI